VAVGDRGRSGRVRQDGGRRGNRGDPEGDEERRGGLRGDRDGRPRAGARPRPPRHRVADPRLLVLLGGADGRRGAGRNPVKLERLAYDPGEEEDDEEDDEEEPKEEDEEDEDEEEEEGKEEEWNG